MKSPLWDVEALSKLDKSQLQALLANANRLNNGELAARCEQELLRRVPEKAKRASAKENNTEGDFVAGYHFVCAGSRGAIINDDGTFWTGSWVVARENVDKSIKFNAYVALHESKNEMSYLQGDIVEYRLRERDMVDKENVGIEFRCRKTTKPLMWNGGGSGEKGYLWGSISSRVSDQG